MSMKRVKSNDTDLGNLWRYRVLEFRLAGTNINLEYCLSTNDAM